MKKYTMVVRWCLATLVIIVVMMVVSDTLNALVDADHRTTFITACLGRDWDNADNIKRCNVLYDRYKYHRDNNWRE